MDSAGPGPSAGQTIAIFVCNRATGWTGTACYTTVRRRVDAPVMLDRQIADRNRAGDTERVVPSDGTVVRGNLLHQIIEGDRIDILSAEFGRQQQPKHVRIEEGSRDRVRQPAQAIALGPIFFDNRTHPTYRRPCSFDPIHQHFLHSRVLTTFAHHPACDP